jgi:protein O-mannosyl-transferase
VSSIPATGQPGPSADEGARPAHTRAREHWWFAAICVVTLLAYGRSFTSPFNLDDYSNIVSNPVLGAPTLKGFLHFARARLLPSATLLFNYWIGGEEEFGYHVVNFAIHLLATLAVYRLALALCRTPRLQQTWLATQSLPLAVAAAFIFACHPIQIQAVTYIIQRISSMAALFYVGSVLFYARARNAQLGAERGRPVLLFIGSALLAVAAFLSKENSASLPFVILLTELTFYPGSGAAKRLLPLAPFLALVLVIPLAWWFIGTDYAGAAKRSNAPFLVQVRHLITLLTNRASPGQPIAPLEYFFTECVVIPRYLGLVVLPWGFNIDHDVPLATGLTMPVAAGAALLAGLLAFGLYALRRWPLVGFGIVWLFLALSVESSFFPIHDVMVEHRMYLAMPGIALVFGTAFAWALRRWRRPALIVGAAAVAMLSTLTFMRNELWRDPLLLWQDALTKSPHKARVYANVGTALHQRGEFDRAIVYYCKALVLDPKGRQASANAYQALADKMERDVTDDPTLLADLPVGPDGTVEVTLPDPCSPAPSE